MMYEFYVKFQNQLSVALKSELDINSNLVYAVGLYTAILQTKYRNTP